MIDAMPDRQAASLLLRKWGNAPHFRRVFAASPKAASASMRIGNTPGRTEMATWRPDPSFLSVTTHGWAKAPKETLAYVAAFDPERARPDAIAVVDVDPTSPSYSQIVAQVDMPNVGDELHHFGWNACSSCLCPNAPHPHVERRYLVVPGLRSSRAPHHRHQAGPAQSEDHPRDRAFREIAEKANYSRLTPFIAAPRASTSTRSPTATVMRPAASSCWITRVSTCSANGKWIVDRRSSPMTSGGISVTTR